MKDMRKRAILIYVIGFIVARASFAGINPLSIGYFTAAYLEKASPGLLFITILTGISTVTAPTMVLKYLLTMVIAITFFESPLIKKRDLPIQVYFCTSAFALGIFAMMESAAFGWKSQLTVMAILEGVIAYVSALIFYMGVGFLLRKSKGMKMTNEEMVSLAIIMAVIVYAVPDINNSYIAAIKTLVYFLIILFTYKYGIGQGAVIGVVCGFVLSMRGESLYNVGALAMMGIIPAIFRSLGRIPTVAVFSLTAGIISLVYEEAAMSVKDVGALTSALIIFLLLPKSIIYRVDSDKENYGDNYLSADNLKKMANTRMKSFSDSFLKLSKTLETITERQAKIKQKEIDLIFEDISEKLCRNCTNCSFCWEENFKEAYVATCNLFEVAEKKGYIEKDDLPVYFIDNCISIDEYILETNRGFEISKLNNIWSNRLSESREIIAGQLKDVSQAIHSLTGDIYGAARVMRSEENKVVRKLKLNHINVKHITIMEHSDKRKELLINASVGKNRCITTKEAANWISEALGVKYVVSGASKSVFSKEYVDYIFVEDTKFKVLTGVARAIKDKISGDNFSIMKLDKGEVVVALSDGTGTGEEAGDESETVLSLLEQLLEAGFKTETSIRMINSNLVLKADKQTFSTIDIGTINLYTGTCEFVKLGAASTFIKRDNWVETISSTTLPIGMLKAVDYDCVSKKLYEGDIVIMVTDGVLDCIEEEDKESYIEKLIMDIQSNNPQEIANRILEGTLSQRNYVPMDDMTVITAGIWLK